MLEVRLLGQFDVRLDGKTVEIPSRPAQSLLAYLILHPGIAHRREKLAGLLWPDSTEANARSYLRHALWRIRKAIGDAYLLVDRIAIAWDANSDYWLDVLDFERETTKNTPADDVLADVSLYVGDLLPGFYDEWVTREQERLRILFEHKMELLLAALVKEGRWRDTLEWGERWIALGHAAEPVYRWLMIAQGGLGNLTAAASVYQRCVKALHDDLGIEPSEQTRTAYEVLMEGGTPPSMPVEATPHAPAPHPPRLPLQTTPFVGRRQELAEIVRLLEDDSCRLLTLVGPSGIGKTRLALQAVEQLEWSGKGVYFVPLAPVTSPALLIPTIAEALGLPFYSGDDPRTQLLHHLRDMEALLILDNFEHLLGGVGLLTEILQCSPAVKLLVTSRERLHLQGEWLFEVKGMEFPKNGATRDIEDYGAVSLFLQNARRLDSGFSPSEQEEAHVVRICQLVEGMPLAIELASSWVRVLSCQGVAEELEKNLDFLAISLQDVPERHRSLRAVFEHSWDLLSEDERAIFRKLSIFRGGFGRKASEQVTGASLSILSALVDKSFLRWAPPSRYQIHQTLLQYGEEKLSERPDEEETVRDLHCAYFAVLLEQMQDDLTEGRQKEVLRAIEDEIDNVRAAWHWAAKHAKLEEIERLLGSLHAFYVSLGWFQEGEEVFGGAIERLEGIRAEETREAIDQILGKVLARRGVLVASLGRYELARGLLHKSLAIARRLDAEDETAFSLDALGSLAWDVGDYTEALHLHQEGLAIRRKLGDQQGCAVSLDNLGITSMILGRYDEAKQLLEESLSIARGTHNPMAAASPLGNLGWVAFVEGEYDRATELFEESIAVSREFGHRRAMALHIAGLSLAVNALGEHERARQLADESLSTSRKIGDKLAIVIALGGLGDALRAEGDYRRARACFLEGFRLAAERGLRSMLLFLSIGWASLLAQEGEREQAVEILALVHHNSVGLEAFGKVAKSRLAELAPELPSEVLVAAEESGKAKELGEVVEGIVGR